MTLTLAQARDEIFTMLKAGWDATGNTMSYPNLPFEIPIDETPWGRTMLSLTPFSKQTLSSINGVKRYTRYGILTVQLFTVSGTGLSSADNYAKIIQDTFEGKSSPNGVWFKNARSNDIGPDGVWYQTNILIDFEFDEIK